MGESAEEDFSIIQLIENSTPSLGVPIAIGITNDIDSWVCFSSMLLVIRHNSGVFFSCAYQQGRKNEALLCAGLLPAKRDR